MRSTNRAVSEAYDRVASTYDRRWSFYVQSSVKETLARLPLAPGERIGDIGCGTGELLRTLLQREPSARLVGVDLSREMLAVAQRKVEEGALVAADAARLPLASGCLDIVVSTNSLHFWRDPPRCLREIARVLRPRGRLIITDWCDDYWACLVCDRFLRIFDRAHHRTYGVGGFTRLLEDAGFMNVTVERYKISWLWGLMTGQAEAHS